ncbi:MAG: hypothetical protein IBJ18_13260 [Phycisphaerales bacterium]|nr:hypothetical protein [Phycisphaerales bacterium]
MTPSHILSAISILLFALALAMLLLIVLLLFRAALPRAHRCPACNHSRKRLPPSAPCPECAAPFSPFPHPPSLRRLAAVLALSVLFLLPFPIWTLFHKPIRAAFWSLAYPAWQVESVHTRDAWTIRLHRGGRPNTTWESLVTVEFVGQTILTLRGDAASDLKSRLNNANPEALIALADIDNDLTPELLIRTRVDYSASTDCIVHVLSQTAKQPLLAKLRINWPLDKADWLTDPDNNHVYQLNTLSTANFTATALTWSKDRFTPLITATK